MKTSTSSLFGIQRRAKKIIQKVGATRYHDTSKTHIQYTTGIIKLDFPFAEFIYCSLFKNELAKVNFVCLYFVHSDVCDEFDEQHRKNLLFWFCSMSVVLSVFFLSIFYAFSLSGLNKNSYDVEIRMRLTSHSWETATLAARQQQFRILLLKHALSLILCHSISHQRARQTRTHASSLSRVNTFPTKSKETLK